MKIFIVCIALGVGLVSADPYDHPHPQNGEWSNWGPWMGCSVTCGGGSDTRMRTCQSGTSGGIEDLLPLLLLSGGFGGDSSSALDMLLPFLLQGGNGGGFGDNPLAMLALLGGLGGDSTDSSSSSNSLLPLLLSGQNIDPTLLLLLSGSNSTIDPLTLLILGGMGGQTETQKYCYGSRMETRTCNQQSCPSPVNCLSQWGQWGECSNGCGAGNKIRSRTCNCHDSMSTYRCNGAQLYEHAQCSSYDACPATTTRIITTTTRPPVNCLSPWSEWGACQATCGYGMKSRTRSCNCHNPSTGMLNCNNAMLYDHTSCSSGIQCGIVIPETPIPATGQWGDWTAYGSCIPSGTRCYKERTRTCPDKMCDGSFKQSIECTCPYCQVDAEQRQECGYGGISRDACKQQNNCCYDDSVPGTIWCFKRNNA
uniref:adhesion G protein-coupled receptor B3-like n=1 Tax=Styela clava TaxID=7725 RepID=UPI0019393E29|nr:adhesion G protein-coupled receptor B3-like [Styela clava]